MEEISIKVLAHYKKELMRFYDIYWRAPSKYEFMDFTSSTVIDYDLFRLAQDDLNFTYSTKPSRTIQVYDEDHNLIFIGTAKDLSEELEIDATIILHRVGINIPFNGYYFVEKTYKWRHDKSYYIREGKQL